MKDLRVAHLLLVAILILLSACSQKAGEKITTTTTDTTSFSVMAGNTDLTETLKKNEGVNSVAKKDDSSLFQSIIADKNVTIPYVKIGEVVSINFGEIPTDQFVLYDYVLNEDGSIKFSSLATETVPIHVSENVGTFKLNENLSSNFSSNSKDYEPGNLLRGFRLITTFGDKQQEYAFVIKSDALKVE